MDHTNKKTIFPTTTAASRKQRVNWHEAAACAIEIELRDYADLLQFLNEYVLGRNSYRIDLLFIWRDWDRAYWKMG